MRNQQQTSISFVVFARFYLEGLPHTVDLVWRKEGAARYGVARGVAVMWRRSLEEARELYAQCCDKARIEAASSSAPVVH